LRQDNDVHDRILTANGGEELYGLPVIGFAVQKYANDALAGASNNGAFYSGVINHKGARRLLTTPQ
jgi:hypothetical protein